MHSSSTPSLDVRLTRSQSGNILDIDFIGGAPRRQDRQTSPARSQPGRHSWLATRVAARHRRSERRVRASPHCAVGNGADGAAVGDWLRQRVGRHVRAEAEDSGARPYAARRTPARVVGATGRRLDLVQYGVKSVSVSLPYPTPYKRGPACRVVVMRSPARCATPAKPSHATPRHTIPRHATPCHTTPYHAALRHATPRHAKPTQSRQAKPNDAYCRTQPQELRYCNPLSSQPSPTSGICVGSPVPHWYIMDPQPSPAVSA